MRFVLNVFLSCLYSLRFASHRISHSIGPVRFRFWYFSILFNFNRIFYKKTMETLIRRCVLQRLVWVCTVCLCPIKRSLSLYGFALFIQGTHKPVLWYTVKTQVKSLITRHSIRSAVNIIFIMTKNFYL